MLALISGRLLSIQDSKIVVVQSGIGFELMCPNIGDCTIGQDIFLNTYLHWSAEQGPSFFGFLSLLEKDLFLMLIDCPGVGPKLGISMLQQKHAVDLISLISGANISGLSALKGLGVKKAEVICAHLKDKISNILLLHPTISKQANVGIWQDLHDTLHSLHYSNVEIKQATAMIKESLESQNVSFDLLLRKSLMILAKK